jgi:hypothetical protein
MGSKRRFVTVVTIRVQADTEEKAFEALNFLKATGATLSQRFGDTLVTGGAFEIDVAAVNKFERPTAAATQKSPKSPN